jgi:hypothetical protein
MLNAQRLQSACLVLLSKGSTTKEKQKEKGKGIHDALDTHHCTAVAAGMMLGTQHSDTTEAKRD